MLTSKRLAKNDVKTSKMMSKSSYWRHVRESSYIPHVRRHFLAPVGFTEIPVGYAILRFVTPRQALLPVEGEETAILPSRKGNTGFTLPKINPCIAICSNIEHWLTLCLRFIYSQTMAASVVICNFAIGAIGCHWYHWTKEPWTFSAAMAPLVEKMAPMVPLSEPIASHW